MRQILADRVDIIYLIASVIVNLNVWIEPLEYKILFFLVIGWPIWDTGDYDQLIIENNEDLWRRKKNRYPKAVTNWAREDLRWWLLGVRSWMNDTHMEVINFASSASPGRLPRGFCVGSGLEKTYATS